jgi:hypothetical protein
MKANRPLAFGLLFPIALHNFPIPFVQAGAVWALGLILMSNLFALVDMATNSRRRRSFENVADAKPAIQTYLKECYRRDHYLEIQWLGMTMFEAWGTLCLALDKLREEGVVENLFLKIAMLEPRWLAVNPINHGWTEQRAQATAASIEAYFAEVRAHRFGRLDWKHEINFYGHMPGVHGCLINGKYLFLGVCQWKSPDHLHAAQCSYYLYTFKEIEDLDKIEIFSGWFDYDSRQKPLVAKAG